MVNPFEIMPVLALAAFIACLPLFATPPEPERVVSRPRRRVVTVPHIPRRDQA